jgi:hypothetical protein
MRKTGSGTSPTAAAGYLHIAMLSSAAELFSKCLTEFFESHPDVQVDVDIKEGAA